MIHIFWHWETDVKDGWCMGNYNQLNNGVNNTKEPTELTYWTQLLQWTSQTPINCLSHFTDIMHNWEVPIKLRSQLILSGPSIQKKQTQFTDSNLCLYSKYFHKNRILSALEHDIWFIIC